MTRDSLVTDTARAVETDGFPDLSDSTVRRAFRDRLALTPYDYSKGVKFNRLRDSLMSGETPAAALYNAGFSSPSRVYETTRFELGMTPASYGKGGKGVVISYCLADSPFGRLAVAATDNGVCAVLFGDSDEELRDGLRARFPAAESLTHCAGSLPDAVTDTIAFIAGQLPSASSIPLDIRMTAFQRRVWTGLMAVPPGKVTSYGRLAAAIGRSGGAQAVGQALTKNPVAVLIPCHRIVADSHFGGYRWGVERKRALLTAESVAIRAG